MTIEVYQFVATVLFSLLMGSMAAATLAFALYSRGMSTRERLVSLETKQEQNTVEIFKRLDKLEKRLFPDPAPATAAAE